MYIVTNGTAWVVAGYFNCGLKTLEDNLETGFDLTSLELTNQR